MLTSKKSFQLYYLKITVNKFLIKNENQIFGNQLCIDFIQNFDIHEKETS